MSHVLIWGKNKDKISTDEWGRRIRELPPGKIRGRIARIVRWDFFGNLPADSQQNVLADLIAQDNKSEELDQKLLVDALVQIGYPEKVAIQRIAPKNRANKYTKSVREIDSLRRSVGEEALLYAVAETAVNDIKVLREKGIIVGYGEVAENWPPPNTNPVVGYSSRAEVQSLIAWVKNGSMISLCESLGLDLVENQVLESIGFSAQVA